jgi:predicted PurR-regulated permease PerM
MTMQTKIIERYFFFGLLFATILFTLLIFRPFWIVLVLGISFAIVLYPIHQWFLKWRIPNSLASFLTVTLFTIILCGPLLGIGVLIFKQSDQLYNSVASEGGAEPFIDKIENTVNRILPDGVNFNMQQKTSEFVSYLSKNTASIFTTTVSAFFSFILMLLIIFYALKDGTHWRSTVMVLSPLSDKDDEKIMSRLERAVNGVITGNLLICLIQGLMVGIGLWIFGVPNGALWGVVAAVASLLPTFGTSLVTVPAILYLLSTGHTNAAIGLIAWSALAVGMIDNFLSPVLVGRKTNIPALLILFAVLGGISLLGPVGILVGPLTISLLYTLISIYRNEFKQSSIL